MKSLILIILLLTFSCKNIEKETMRLSDFQKQIDSLLSARIGDDDPGAGILISLNDSILFQKGYGLRDLKTKAPVTTSTNFNIGSVSKQFTALGILTLIEQNKLNLNDSIYKFYPFKSLEGVTIKHLLTHTSGLVDVDTEFMKMWTLDRPATNEDVIDWYKNNDRKEFNPGEKFEYNNSAYEILASLIEKISGKEFSEYMREYVLEKAGMNNSLFYRSSKPTQIPERAFCYAKDSTETWQKMDGHYLDGMVGAGGLYTNLEDFEKYFSAIRHRKILTTEIDSLLFLPEVEVKELADRDFYIIKETGSFYGMGWEVNETMAVHGGEIFGAHAFVIHEFNRPLSIAIFMNSNSLFHTEPNLLNEIYKLTNNYLNTFANSGYK